MDDWTLIRAKDGRAGWVLTRMLFMSIPDEVAQSAERARITAYFSIGNVVTRGDSKPVWLWATLSQPGQDYHFDSLRIFTWNPRRRRYETSFVERNLKGFLPLRLYSPAPTASATGFRVVVQEKSGSRAERDYALQSFRARIVARRQPPPINNWYRVAVRTKPAFPSLADTSPAAGAKSFLDRLRDRLKR